MTAQFQRFLPYEKGKENWPTSAGVFLGSASITVLRRVQQVLTCGV